MYAQVTQLFNTAPDLLEDFKQFLPESAAHAKQQQQQRLAEESITTSNLRGDPMGLSQTPNRDVKMPPLGQFNHKDLGKDSKKRRGGPGGGVTSISGPGGVDSSRLPDAQGRGQAPPYGNALKVSTSRFLLCSAFVSPLPFCSHFSHLSLASRSSPAHTNHTYRGISHPTGSPPRTSPTWTPR